MTNWPQNILLHKVLIKINIHRQEKLNLPKRDVRYVTPNEHELLEIPKPRLVVRHAGPRVGWRWQNLPQAAVVHAGHVAEIEGHQHGARAGAKRHHASGVHASLQTEAKQLRQSRQQPAQLLWAHRAPVEHQRSRLPPHYALYVRCCHSAVRQAESRPQAGRARPHRPALAHQHALVQLHGRQPTEYERRHFLVQGKVASLKIEFFNVRSRGWIR